MGQLLKLVMISLLMVACVNNSARNLQQGIESFRVQDYRRAFVFLKPLARRGQADAQYAVGYMYYYGQGVVESRKRAWYWINMAANAGQPDALLAVKILEHGTAWKEKVFNSRNLQHFPRRKQLY